jgi:hypothetical protein
MIHYLVYHDIFQFCFDLSDILEEYDYQETLLTYNDPLISYLLGKISFILFSFFLNKISTQLFSVLVDEDEEK